MRFSFRLEILSLYKLTMPYTQSVWCNLSSALVFLRCRWIPLWFSFADIPKLTHLSASTGYLIPITPYLCSFHFTSERVFSSHIVTGLFPLISVWSYLIPEPFLTFSKQLSAEIKYEDILSLKYINSMETRGSVLWNTLHHNSFPPCLTFQDKGYNSSQGR